MLGKSVLSNNGINIYSVNNENKAWKVLIMKLSAW